MKLALGASFFISTASLCDATLHHHGGLGGGSCKHGAACGNIARPVAFPQQVVIPQFLPTQTLVAPKPLLHKHGLIQVQLPPTQQVPFVAPSVMATRSEFKVASARMGKVVDQTAPQYFCKRPGFVLEGQTCVQTLVEPARFVCPGGFETFDGSCQRRAAFLQSCPLGYSRRDGNCAKIITAAFVNRCPEGTFAASDTECIRQVPHPLTPTCPEGTYDGRTGSCTVQAFMEARAFCPEGFSFVDGTCLQEEIYDCTSHPRLLPELPKLPLVGPAPVALIAAPQTTVLQTTDVVGHTHGHGHGHVGFGHGHGHAHKRQLTATKDCGGVAAAAATTCTCTVQPCPPCVAQRALPCETEIAAVAAPKVITQPTKTTISVQKTCTRVTSTALIFACDEGILQGNRCLIRQQVAPIPVCHAEGDAAFCFARQRVPPLQECPPDYTKECLPGRPCECVALEAAAFLTSCPSGFDEQLDGCVRIAQARPVCPPGYAQQGDTCIQVLREPADCVFSVTYECDHANGTECQPPAAGAVGTFAVTPTTPVLPVPVPVF